MPSSAWSSDVCSSDRSEEHTSELQSLTNLVCRLLLEKKKNNPKLQQRLILLSLLALNYNMNVASFQRSGQDYLGQKKRGVEVPRTLRNEHGLILVTSV